MDVEAISYLVGGTLGGALGGALLLGFIGKVAQKGANFWMWVLCGALIGGGYSGYKAFEDYQVSTDKGRIAQVILDQCIASATDSTAAAASWFGEVTQEQLVSYCECFFEKAATDDGAIIEALNELYNENPDYAPAEAMSHPVMGPAMQDCAQKAIGVVQ
jgi:hypothetical protein